MSANSTAKAQAGPYAPGQTKSVLYAMAGDDCSLYFDLDSLTPKQMADHVSNIELTGMLQVALHYMGKPADHVAMFDAFRSEPWRTTLDFYHGAYARMGIEPIPLEHCHFHPRDNFYDSVAQSVADGAVATDLLGLYLISGSNAVLHGSDDALAVSRRVNSKMQLAADARAHGIPVPETLVCTKADLDSDSAAAFLRRHDNQVMLKILGLAGARNVTTVTSLAEARKYLQEYEPGMEVVLQRKLAAEEFTEMTVDLTVSEHDIEIANVRRILFSDGLWVGNLIGGSVTLDPAHEAVLLKVGEYVREQGYGSAEGYNCGIDYFISDEEILITEINARWTGGLFPARMTRALGLGGTDVVAFFDIVSLDGLGRYLDFHDRHLHPAGGGAFSSIPLGFSPYPFPMAGRKMVYVWQMVAGDLEAFKAAKQQALAPGDLPTADNISLVV